MKGGIYGGGSCSYEFGVVQISQLCFMVGSQPDLGDQKQPNRSSIRAETCSQNFIRGERS